MHGAVIGRRADDFRQRCGGARGARMGTCHEYLFVELGHLGLQLRDDLLRNLHAVDVLLEDLGQLGHVAGDFFRKLQLSCSWPGPVSSAAPPPPRTPLPPIVATSIIIYSRCFTNIFHVTTLWKFISIR